MWSPATIAKIVDELDKLGDELSSSTVELSSDSSYCTLDESELALIAPHSTPERHIRKIADENTPLMPIPILAANAPNRIRPARSPVAESDERLSKR